MKPQVIFYYPQHFNRSEEGTNPFFDKLLEACNQHNISYRLYEEPDGGTNNPRNPKAMKADLFFWTVTALRKFFTIMFRKRDFYERESFVAKVLNLISFGRYKVPTYVTISGSMYHLFSELNPKAKVYDMQHGILYKGHYVFFDENSRLRPQFYRSNLHWLMWGEGYKEIFVKGEEKMLQDRVHVIGYPISQQHKVVINKEKTALISLQFTHDWDASMNGKQKALLDDTLQHFSRLGYRVLLRHHPRFNKVIEIDDLLTKYDFVEITTLSFDQLVNMISLHVTYNSTTAFEYAQYGIPTVFMSNDDFPQYDNLFYKEYKYPLFEGMDVEESLLYLENNATLDVIKDWSRMFYSRFDPEVLLKLL